MIKVIVSRKCILSSSFSPSKSSLTLLDQPLILVNEDTEQVLKETYLVFQTEILPGRYYWTENGLRAFLDNVISRAKQAA